MPFAVQTEKAHRLDIVRPARGEQQHPIFIGTDWFDDIVRMISEHIGDHMVAVIVDDVVADLHKDKLQKLYENLPRVRILPIKGDEATKQLETFNQIQEFLLEHEIHRDDYIISFGGVTIGSLAGFAAATYMRGIHWISLPTTVVSQFDSSIGGKNGVNLGSNKNYCGTFYWPDAVFIDLNHLSTLKDRAFRTGLVKMVKLALIGDKDLFHRIRSIVREKGLAGIRENLEELVIPTIKVKAGVIASDPYQYGVRLVLEMGHTTAHALEGASRLRMMHGEAVSIGLAFEANIAQKRGMISEEEVKYLIDILDDCGLPTALPPELHDRLLVDYMSREKHNRGRDIALVLPYKIGAAIEQWPAPQVSLTLSEMWTELAAYRLENG